MPQNLAEWAGVFGLLLALVSLLIHCLQYRHQKKAHKEEVEERVDVRLGWGQVVKALSSPLVATVVNAGRAKVHLDRVELLLGPENPRIGESVLSIPLTCATRGGPVVEPGDKREYFVPPGHPMLARFAGADPAEIRLVVYSNRGEIKRVSGEEIAPCLRLAWPPEGRQRPSDSGEGQGDRPVRV